MSRATVYQGLKTAILYKQLPYHHFEDSNCTIAFTSWEQFEPVDAMLDSLPMPNDLNIWGDCRFLWHDFGYFVDAKFLCHDGLEGIKSYTAHWALKSALAKSV